MIFGIGLSPLLQWLILPPAMVGAYRMLGPVLFGRHSSQSPIPTHDVTRGRHDGSREPCGWCLQFWPPLLFFPAAFSTNGRLS